MTEARRTLRILLVTSTPWSTNLGASRVLVELAEEFERLGHEVEKFSQEDAFSGEAVPLPARLRPWWSHYRTVYSFPRRVRRFVRDAADRFDVIDAMHADLPFPKSSLRFRGLLVARSVALAPAYVAFEELAAKRWPGRPTPAEVARRIAGYLPHRKRIAQAEASLRHADLVNVSNRDDLEFLKQRRPQRDKVLWQPLGISAARYEALGHEALPALERLRAQTVVFIGTWNDRKGAWDWPEIASAVSQSVPQCRFRFLGTGFSREYVLRGFPAEVRPRCDVIPSFETHELPALLSNTTVGVFPSYCEGFGIALLEKLASGLPTVAYDAPGPRDILSGLSESSMVPPGDTNRLAHRVIKLLRLDAERFAERSAEARRLASSFLWPKIAAATVESYQDALHELGRPSRSAADSGHENMAGSRA